ncbi:spore germination protein [Paenisporosarcina quisquiliarum]|uniref:Spore germination protein n=1 Tax=Paenisporosarcina quisquiliarum TaxID=365346 RepID=A0A9X3REJ1_9BACL|nr:spore germination protein [Paenisporosarcina quisquiliarum]MCZ8537453.1 spore germination protein [Paenisporosarcina quisquiliarum]
MFKKRFNRSSKREKPSIDANENKKSESNQKENVFPSSSKDYLQTIKDHTNNPSDLVVKTISPNITVTYMNSLVDDRTLKEQLIPELIRHKFETPESLKSSLFIPEVDVDDQINHSVLSMYNGTVLIHLDGFSQVVLAKITTTVSRALAAPENESQVIGAQVGFNESLSSNESLIRRYIKNPELCNERFNVGKQTNTTVAFFYIKGIASEQMVNTLRQRISDLKIDSLLDSAVLAEYIDDNSLSPFPQMLLTERPDRFCDGLLNGKLGVIVDGSSMAILCPHAFIEFFQSREDQNLRWPIASFLRLLRFSAVFLSIYLTPLYVAALTFHYEIIPQSLLVPLSESRALVPFPPIIEALLLELIIELLREAGARLPTKVGQTIGIVGGIVIGTAAVQAGITSNILIIIVALSALASFTTPSYMMGNVIRVVRFPLILLAGFWGFYGIMLGFCFILIHLIRQSSLGSPYTAPFYPPRFMDWRDSIIRLPLPFTYKRQKSVRPQNEEKYQPEPINPEKS